MLVVGERRGKHEGWPSLKLGGRVSLGWPVAKSRTLAPGGLFATPGLSSESSAPPGYHTIIHGSQDLPEHPFMNAT